MKMSNNKNRDKNQVVTTTEKIMTERKLDPKFSSHVQKPSWWKPDSLHTKEQLMERKMEIQMKIDEFNAAKLTADKYPEKVTPETIARIDKMKAEIAEML